ncbi:probable glutamate receptor [Panulirus ornatus]|uniref:probable glutamate receptor n=1 Tax=Panulirus ornatus TaxID=150431 RepID=UPI003A892A01
MDISLRTLEIEDAEDMSILSVEASVSQVLVDVERQELRECDLVLTYDAGFSQQAKLQDLLLLYNTPQEARVNKPDVLRLVSKSILRRKYPSLQTHLERLRTHTSNNDDIRRYRSSRRADQDLTLVDLVSYLISLTSGRQFYLVYDDVMPGVAGVVRTFQEMLGDTILLPYDPSILLLTEALTSNYHVQAMRNVFILCSVPHVFNIFEQVMNNVLESPTIQWFIIVDEDLTEELPVLLREGTQVRPGYKRQQGNGLTEELPAGAAPGRYSGTLREMLFVSSQVALVQRVTHQKAQLFSSRVDPDGQIRFHQVGWWSVSGTRPTNSHQVKGGLVPDLHQLYSDFQGRQLVVSTVNHWPFFKITTLDNGTVIPISGIDLSLINTLGETLNFTCKIVGPTNGKWGGPQPDNTVTGIVGQVARHEAHAALCSLTITAIRETVVDFTDPYYLESATLMSPAPKEKNRSFAILSPFTIEVWLCICLATVLVGPLLYMVSRLLVVHLDEEDSVHYSLQSFSFNMFRNLMNQCNLIISRRWSIRFLFISWYLFSFYLYALYSGTLTAALAITAYEKPIDSIHELAQAHRDGYTIGTLRDSNFVEAFKTADSGIYQEMWQLFNHEDPDQSFLSTEKAIKMILKQKYVFIGSRLNVKLNAARWGLNKFYFARQTFLPQGFGIACSSGSPYKDVFSSILIRLTEAGLVTKWANDEVNKVAQNISPLGNSGPSAISLQHLQAAFFIMVLGFGTSTIVLSLEILASRC